MELFSINAGYLKKKSEIRAIENLTYQPAVKYISQLSKKYDILLINEAHHVSRHRLFTKKLLKNLWGNNYRFLGLEALQPKHNIEINKNNKILRGQQGFYLNDPNFIEMINEALKLGFYVFGYESIQTCDYSDTNSNCQNLREEGQVNNILKLIKTSNDKGKLLIHAGYGHIAKKGIGDWKPMAEFLIEKTKSKILSVDQVTLFQSYSRDFDNPTYRFLDSKYKFKEEVIFFKNSNPLITTEGIGAYDIQVFSPRKF